MNQSTIEQLATAESIQLVTFRCGDLLAGLELTDVQEINRINRYANVPDAPPQVRGVINLRGEVVTMIDLRVVLNQPASESDANFHNVFVRSEDEVIGLITDGVSDILTVSKDTIDATPCNLKEAESVLYRGVHKLHTGELIVILDLSQVLSTTADPGLAACG